MIYKHNFITNVHDARQAQPQTYLPSHCHAPGSAAPQKLSKLSRPPNLFNFLSKGATALLLQLGPVKVTHC